MTRSIVTRFPARCYDCGVDLPVGSTVRFFGKGRVSCCGGDGARRPVRSDSVGPAAAPTVEPVNERERERELAVVHGADDACELVASLRGAPAPSDADLHSIALDKADRRGYCSGFVRTEGLRAVYVRSFVRTFGVELAKRPAPAPASLAALHVVVHVELASGATLTVPQQHVHHVLACIVESMRDKIVRTTSEVRS